MSAPLYFRYGSYTHPAGEVLISSITRSVAEYSPRGEPIVSRLSWTIEGILQGDDAADVSRRLVALERAYEQHNQVAGLYFVGGGSTAHVMSPAGSLGGVRSSGVSYPKGDGAEYTTYRTYSVTLEADYPFDGLTLLEFQESVTFTGTGGKKTVFLPVLNGEPEKQTVLQRTTCKATQSGSAVGFKSYPPVPDRLWPADEIEEARSIARTSPMNLLGDKRNFGITWSYSYESAKPLTGLPNSL